MSNLLFLPKVLEGPLSYSGAYLDCSYMKICRLDITCFTELVKVEMISWQLILVLLLLILLCLIAAFRTADLVILCMQDTAISATVQNRVNSWVRNVYFWVDIHHLLVFLLLVSPRGQCWAPSCFFVFICFL